MRTPPGRRRQFRRRDERRGWRQICTFDRLAEGGEDLRQFLDRERQIRWLQKARLPPFADLQTRLSQGRDLGNLLGCGDSFAEHAIGADHAGQSRDHLRRRTHSDVQIATTPGDFGREALQGLVAKRETMRAPARKTPWCSLRLARRYDMDKQKPVRRRARLGQRGVVRQPQIAPKPVDRVGHA